MDLVRCGISTYGLYPSAEVMKENVPLKPAMELISHVAHVKWVDEGTLIMSGLKAEDVCVAINCVTGQLAMRSGLIRTVPDYDVDNVAEKVVRIILSYTRYIDRIVWKKY